MNNISIDLDDELVKYQYSARRKKYKRTKCFYFN